MSVTENASNLLSTYWVTFIRGEHMI